MLAATLSPSYGIYSGFENFENVPVPRRAPRSTCDSEKYEIKSARSTGRCCRWSRALNAIRRAQPGAAGALRTCTFLDTGQRRADRLRQADGGADMLDHGRQHRPAQRAGGAGRRSRRPRPAARFTGPRPAVGRALRRGGSARNYVRLEPGGRRGPRPPGAEFVSDRDRLHAQPTGLARRALAGSAQRPSPQAETRAGPAPSPADTPVVRVRPAVVQARGLLRDPPPRLLRRATATARATSAG